MDFFVNVLLSIVAIGIAIWSVHSTAEQADQQIKEIKNLSKLHLATAIAANKRMMLEINDELKIKKENLAKNVTVLNERKEVMEANIARLEKIYEDCEKLQMEYEDFKKKFN